MDYSYFSAPDNYNFYNLPQKPVHPYTPQDDFSSNPIDTYADPATFSAFDPNDPAFSYQSDPRLVQTVPQQPQSPPSSLHRPSLPTSMSQDAAPDMAMDMEAYDQGQGGRSSDEDKESRTPALSRRKAQNRAAQRAFRERKERHVKDLEIKLNNLTSTNASILTEKERLEREVERLATQNEILRATSQTFQSSGSPNRPESPISGPQVFSPKTFHEVMTEGHGGSRSGSASGSRSTPESSHRIAISAITGERLLGTGPTWDLIQNHELYKRGMVDLGRLCENLKDKAVCDGTGPAYPESAVRKAIEDSVGGAGDELI